MTPVTTPLALPIVATPVFPELHIPPVTALLSVSTLVAQRTDDPAIVPVAGVVFTLTIAVALLVHPNELVTVRVGVKVPDVV